jgi:hypothetical protein
MEIQVKKPEMSVGEVTVVLIGDFNPKIFHPMWFAYHGILREAEAKEAGIEVIHADVSSFSTEWLTVQVLRDRFTASIKAEVYRSHLGDLVRNVFSQLSHSPVEQLGINTTFCLHFRSEDDWHAFGHMILPKSPWTGVLERPGLRTTNVQGDRTDQHRGLVNFTIGPDVRRAGDAVVRYNDHFERPRAKGDRPEDVSSARWALEILQQDFDASYARAKEVVMQLINNFTKTKTVDSGR